MVQASRVHAPDWPPHQLHPGTLGVAGGFAPEQFQLQQVQLVTLQKTVDELNHRVQTLDGTLTGTTAALQRQILELFQHLSLTPKCFDAPTLLRPPLDGCPGSGWEAREAEARERPVRGIRGLPRLQPPNDCRNESVFSEVSPVAEQDSFGGRGSFGNLNEANISAYQQRERTLRSSSPTTPGGRGSLPDALTSLAHQGFSSVNALQTGGRTALHHAAERGLEDLCKALLNHQDFIRVNEQDLEGRTALHHAARRGHANVCRALLQHHRFSAQNETDMWGRSALQDAIAYGHNEARDVLLEHPRFQVQGRYASEASYRPTTTPRFSWEY